MGSLSGNLASMVPGVPYAIAAKFAHQDRPAIAFVGDGAMQMLGLNELITARHYYSVGRPETDRVRPEQWRPEHGHLGDEGLRGESQIRGVPGGPVVPYAEFAEMIGLRGIKVEKPEEVGPAGTNCWLPTAPRCWKWSATRMSRPSHPMSPSINSGNTCPPCSKATQRHWEFSGSRRDRVAVDNDT